jgi:hypothetical protein
MKRLLTSALAAAVVAAGTGREAQAQETMNRRASLFDLGLYAGGAYSTSWFKINDDGFKPGWSPIFGLTATYWATPSFGIRAHGAYMPSNFPEDGNGFDGNDDWAVNNWFYDLGVAFRPWITNMGTSNWLGSMYFFAAGGGLTSNVAGTNAINCAGVALYLANGVCLPTESDLGTVGQGVVGLGFDLIPITSAVGIFGELAVHGYESPAHIYGNIGTGEDKFAFTPRASLGVKFAFGNQLAAPVVAPPPPPEPMPVPTPEPVEQVNTINVCVIDNGQLREVQAQYNVTRGDTTVNGTPFSSAFPATSGYAAGATWYINSDAITIGNQRYVKFGLPRVVGVSDVTRIGEYQGVGVFAEPGATRTPDIIYIPVRPGCEFQPYQKEVKVRNVRG